MARRRKEHPGQDDFFEPPDPWKLARTGDPSTSFSAAARISPEILIIRGKTLWWFRLQWPKARTLLDLENRFDNHKSSYRTRCSELVRDGLILDTGRDVFQDGSPRRLWIAAPWWMEEELKKPSAPGHPAGWCIHYRSALDSATCAAGVSYRRWRTHDMRPCFLDDKGQSRPEASTCEHLRRPTPEEIAAHKKWMNERMALYIVVMDGIQPWREKYQGQSHYGLIECPACKGKLHLTIATNCHIHGHCETEECVDWME